MEILPTVQQNVGYPSGVETETMTRADG